jgi:hypothetical protein
VKEVQD